MRWLRPTKREGSAIALETSGPFFEEEEFLRGSRSLHRCARDHLHSVLIIELLKDRIGKVQGIDHPTSLEMMALRDVEIFIFCFQKTPVQPIGLGIRRRIRSKHHAILIFDEELSRRIRLASQLAKP